MTGQYIYGVVLTVSLAIPGIGIAQGLKLHAGEYILEGGNGELSLQENDRGRFAFSISSVGANGHQCSLDGEIEGTQARVKEIVGGRPCIVSFRPTARGIAVGTESEGCRDFCGVRAGFDGEYLTPVRGCARNEVVGTRNKFKKLYDAKAFVNAKSTLEPLLLKCTDTLSYVESAWIRNDLAITNYRLKDFSACMTALKPLEDVAMTYIDAKSEDISPWLLDILPVMRATLANLRLCSVRPR